VPKTEFLIEPGSEEGKRLDVFLAEKVPSLSRSRLKRLISAGAVTVGGAARRSSYPLKAGDRVVLEYASPEAKGLRPEDISLRVLYEDGDVIVLDKPSGLVVHPGVGNASGTLANALLFRYPEVASVGPPERPGIVHRLDKETSGVMIAARSVRAYDSLVMQFKRKEVWKIYLGLVRGKISSPEGRISWAIGRHATDGKRISVRSRNPKDAETRFKVLETFRASTLLEIRPMTGRTHQIRVHLAAAGHPVIGDRLYGGKKGAKEAPRLFLHAHILSFIHPATGKRLEFVSPLPRELEAVLESERQGPVAAGRR
jgi:23S rRNA pseudouridine1911/1915/1917 synthase